ncbi:MAG TPA: hypothetical protein VGI26_01265 [Solirubrobacteraceae bacterium]
MTDAWDPYRDAVYKYYKVAQPALNEERELIEDREVPAAERALQEVVERSRALTEIGEAQLRLSQDAEYDRVALLLLAAGAVDVAVACEGLRICPDHPVADPVFTTEEPETPERALGLLKEADELFGGNGLEPEDDDPDPQAGGSPPVAGGEVVSAADGEGYETSRAEASSADLQTGSGGPAPLAGGAVNPVQYKLIGTVSDSFDALIEGATEPGYKFATGSLLGTGGGFHITAGVEPLERLHTLARHVGVIKRRLVRLLASGFQKLLASSAAQSHQLIGRAVAAGEGIAKDFAQGLLEARFGGLLGWLVRRDDAAHPAEEAIEQANALDTDSAADIERALEELTGSYHHQMKWAGNTAKWLSWASPFISTLAVHVGGPVLVVGLNAAGFGFVIYTLDVRIDGHGLPARVRSIVQIVTDDLAHLT